MYVLQLASTSKVLEFWEFWIYLNDILTTHVLTEMISTSTYVIAIRDNIEKLIEKLKRIKIDEDNTLNTLKVIRQHEMELIGC